MMARFSKHATLSFLAGLSLLLVASASGADASTTNTANSNLRSLSSPSLASRVESLEALADEQRQMIELQVDMIEELMNSSRRHRRHLQTTSSSCTPAFDVTSGQCVFHNTARFDAGIIASLEGSDNSSKNDNRRNLPRSAIVIEGDLYVEGTSLFQEDVTMEKDLLVKNDLQVVGKADLVVENDPN
jgi:hypothetical protein